MILYITARLMEEWKVMRGRLLDAEAGDDGLAVAAAILGLERKLLDIRDYVAGFGTNLQPFTFCVDMESFGLALMQEEPGDLLPAENESVEGDEPAIANGMTLPIGSAKRKTELKWLPREEDSLLEWLVRIRKDGFSGNLLTAGDGGHSPLLDLPYGHFPVQ